MSEFLGITVIGGIIIPMLIFAVGLASLKSNKTAARVFMFVAIGWMLIASFTIPPIKEFRGCLVSYSYDTPIAVVDSVIFWSMIIISIIVLSRQKIQNRKAVYKIDAKPKPKKDEYYDDEL